jgi:hypothetical protein
MTLPFRVAFLFVALSLPSSIMAETRIRSGEHANFSRLVFYFPAEIRGWKTSQVDNGYLIDADPGATQLDISEVFDFIPRTRIQDINLRDGQIWIESECDCHLSVFLARSNVLAVDLRDGPDPDIGPEPESAVKTTRSVGLNLPLILDDEDFGAAPTLSLVAFLPPQPSPNAIDPNALASAVASATSGGLLDRSTQISQLDGRGIETRTGFKNDEPNEAEKSQSDLCQKLSLLDSLPEITPGGAWEVIENGPNSQSETQLLAMAYLSLGFGAEAAAAFGDSNLPADVSMLLGLVAHAVDGTKKAEASGLQSIRNCGGVSGLLALLSITDDSVISRERGRDLIAILSSLSVPLREHLAPLLEKKLEKSGYADLALSARFTRIRVVESAQLAERSAAYTSVTGGDSQVQEDVARLPESPFFERGVSGDALDAIAVGRFDQEDRILIEAWIQEAPSIAEADAATSLYVSALNRLGRSLDALSHLDARIGRQGALRPPIQAAVADTLEAAENHLGPAALILLGARVPERPWYKKLPREVRDGFEKRTSEVRFELLRRNRALLHINQIVPEDSTEIDGSASLREMEVTDRQHTSDQEISNASESIVRSERLRVEAANIANKLAGRFVSQPSR